MWSRKNHTCRPISGVLLSILWSLAAGTLTNPQLAFAQTPSTPSFEVASIRPNITWGSRPIDSINLNMLRAMAYGSRRDRFEMMDTPLTVLIQLAYNVRDFQVLGTPSWANSDRYDINAKTEGGTNFDQMRPMLQSLLRERFRLTFHRETKEVSVYELTVAKGGLKVQAAKEGSCTTFDPSASPPRFDPSRSVKICGDLWFGEDKIARPPR